MAVSALPAKTASIPIAGKPLPQGCFIPTPRNTCTLGLACSVASVASPQNRVDSIAAGGLQVRIHPPFPHPELWEWLQRGHPLTTKPCRVQSLGKPAPTMKRSSALSTSRNVGCLQRFVICHTPNRVDPNRQQAGYTGRVHPALSSNLNLWRGLPAMAASLTSQTRVEPMLQAISHMDRIHPPSLTNH